MKKSSTKNALTIFQYHLYQNPLYEFVGADDREINVALLGFGKFSPKFLDCCLQFGQVLSKKLNVKIFSEDDSSAENYLKERPALKNFFSVDKRDDSEESYGKIFFDSLVVEPTESELKEFFEEIVGLPHYIFIDFGDDAKSERVAVACKKVLAALKGKARISFVREDTDPPKKFPRGIVPVFVNDNIKKFPVHAEIERMAFNAHLVYEKNLNVDFNEVKKNFLDPYNHAASVATVVTIKYKLHEYNLNPDKTDAAELAEKFSRLKFDSQDESDYIFAEHKRWVTEKICDGWQVRPVKDCGDGKTKDGAKKLHACIVKSRPDRLLRDKFPAETWNSLTKKELAELDELDALSVRLHKLFAERAEQIRSELDLINKLTDNLQAALEFDPKILMSFQELKVCFKDIFNGDAKKVRLYENLSDNFKKNLDRLPKNLSAVLKENFAILEGKFRPLLKSMEFWDYKQDDAAMVENIPFILTYSENICLAVPFAAGEVSELFKNVAAATVIKPKKIFYLIFCEDRAALNQLKNCLPNVLAYNRRKNLHAEIELVIACAEKIFDFDEETRAIKKFGIQKISFAPVKDATNPAPEVIALFKKFLLRRAKNSAEFTALEINSTRVAAWLQGAGVCADVPAFSFDSARMTFKSINHCAVFTYIAKKNFITMNDLTALNNSFGNIGDQPTFLEDYRELWEEYKKNYGRDWKNLCGKLKAHAEASDVLATFSRTTDATVKRYRYLLPSLCLKVVEKILCVLEKEKIVDARSNVKIFDSATCEVVIVDPCKNKSKFDLLFSNPYKLMLAEAISFAQRKWDVAVSFDALNVSGLDVSTDNNLSNLINFLAEKNYLTGLRTDAGKISFAYATREIKNLLTNEGKLLEIFVYHEAKRTGGFDDVAMNFEPHWSDFGVNNEFDCVLSKNFRTLIVECKAQNQIKQDFYFKLFALAKKFGVNATAVLIADTRDLRASTINAVQRKRGAELGIVTIQDDLDNIGEILLKLLDDAK